MKKIIFLTAFFVFVLTNSSIAQDSNKNKNTGYCILKVYGYGHSKANRGIYIIYEDLKIEKKDLNDLEQETVWKATVENINILKNKGYVLISSSTNFSSVEINEYIFKKEE